jgi:hypothetical protein
LIKSDSYQRVTYKARGPNWLVLSGLRSIEGREQVFYEKYLFGARRQDDSRRCRHLSRRVEGHLPLVGRIANSLHGS